jgi:putative DNA primase/helicase
VNAKPCALSVVVDGIPVAMKAEPRWAVWRWTLVGDDWKKPPYRLDAPDTKAGVDDLAKGWGSFEDAVRLYEGGAFDGVGFLLGDRWAGVDLDDCRNPETGELTPFALDVIRMINSYAEISPSGTGLKIFVRAEPGKNHAKGGCEVAGHGRYFTVTGWHL